MAHFASERTERLDGLTHLGLICDEVQVELDGESNERGLAIYEVPPSVTRNRLHSSDGISVSVRDSAIFWNSVSSSG